MVSSFYVVLPSNASFKTFKDNKLHTYKVKIPKLPSTEGDWVVGLTEICYPSCWPNIKDEGTIYIKWNDSEEIMDYPVPPGFYPNIDKLLKKIIDILHLNKSGVGNKLSFIYDEISNRVVTFIAQDAEFKICFSSNVAAPLGLESGKFYSKGPHLAPYPADIHDGSSTLYVYSDIVQKRLVGDNMLPLLKVIPAEPMQTVPSHKWVRFKNIEYISSVKTHIDTVEINIRRDNGEIIPFESGKVVVTLHFKIVL
mgnify:FL=1